MLECPTTGVEIRVGAFLSSLFYCKPIITIDGISFQKSWGTHFFELHPGRHIVKVHFPWLFLRECGRNSVEAPVRAEQVTRISYYVPPWMPVWGRGIMKVTD